MAIAAEKNVRHASAMEVRLCYPHTALWPNTQVTIKSGKWLTQQREMPRVADSSAHE